MEPHGLGKDGLRNRLKDRLKNRLNIAYLGKTGSSAQAQSSLVEKPRPFGQFHDIRC
jgi:hypothetical protein